MALTPFQRSLDPAAIYAKPPRNAQQAPPPPRALRIASWNVGRGYDPARLARTLRAIDPDIACLQEVDWGNERTGNRDVLQELADATGLYGSFGVEFLELASPHRSPRLAGGGVTGNALLSRVEPTASFRVELPAAFDWTADPAGAELPRRLRRVLRREKRQGGRFGLAADYRIGGLAVTACSIHLEDKSGGIAGRARQYHEAAEALGRRHDSQVTIIAGDLNTFDSRLARLSTGETNETALGKPTGMAEAAWWKSSVLPPTGFADDFAPTDWTFAVPPLFRAKLDWITVKGGTVTDRHIGGFASSDHRPIWVDVCGTGQPSPAA